MKQAALLAVLLVVVLGLGCTAAAPDPGEVAVIVKKPWIFGHGGVRVEVVATGREWFALSTSALLVDVKPMQFTMYIDDMFSKDNVPLDFNAALRVRIVDPVKLVRDFGTHNVPTGKDTTMPAWYWNNVHKPWERAIRQAVKDYGMSELVADTIAEGKESSTIEEIDRSVSETMAAYFKSIDLPVELVDVTIGRATPPDEIKNERVATATQDQRSNTEKRRKLAEDQRREAEKSRAAADNAYREAMQLSPDQFLRLETIKMQDKVCGSEGKANCTFLVGGSVSPVLDVARR
ncbi:MAG: SPFH domain-containing protein [Candidatus Liptonbacteria bacterium]|nr:SPFH domain-containing protein [Candidatus Liptonbacteria bacterium]